MPSPFPGMDPFIEDQKWLGFLTRFITGLGQALVPQVRPQYVVDVEEYVYLGHEPGASETLVRPDVAIAETGTDWRESAAAAETAVKLQPVTRRVQLPRRHRQPYLVIRNREWHDVVAVIELLSPWNKAAGTGQTEYLTKRQNLLAAPAHLVKLDLLRGGARLPTTEPLPPGDYFAFVTHCDHQPHADVYFWSLRDPLPTIPVPLSPGDPAARLDLAPIFTTTYDRAGYDYALNYRRPLTPPLPEPDAPWLHGLLADR